MIIMDNPLSGNLEKTAEDLTVNDYGSVYLNLESMSVSNNLIN